MKRYFYLVLHTMRPFTFMDEKQFCYLVFQASDVKDHLADKLFTARNRYTDRSEIRAIFDFYEALDSLHQAYFDIWFNAEIDKTDAKTVQHNMEFLADPDGFLDKLLS